MIKTAFIVIGVTFCQFTAAQPAIVEVGPAKYRFEDRRFKEIFSQTLIFGHSISSNLRHRFSTAYGAGPGNILAEKYAQVPPLANIAEGAGTMETGLSKMARWIRNEQDTDAAPGADRDINVMNRHFDNSTVLVGIDALYMSVVFNECEDYGDRQVSAIIENFVRKSYEADKVLILGNVPKENWDQAAPAARWILKNDNEQCRQVINRALGRACTPERNCYLTDLAALVDTLNTTGQLVLKDGTVLKDDPSQLGRVLGRRQVRPDGINMSQQGIQVIVEDILARMDKNPPHARPRGENIIPAPAEILR